MAYFKKPSDVRVGVIGYGGAFNMGRAHLTQMQRAGMTPFAVCDTDPARLDIAKDDFPGVETYDDLDAMLKGSDVDLIVHITPHHLHYPLAAKCIRAGKHVVTEKPFVVTTSEADRLIRLAEKHDRMVTTYHNRHWDGWIIRAVREIVDKGVIGEVYRVRAGQGGYGMPKDWWRSSRSISGGILYDWGVHLLEYALQVVRSEIVEVTGYAKTGHWADKAPKAHPYKDDLNEDEASLTVRFANDAWLDLTVTQLGSDPLPYRIGFFGTKGCYLIDFGQGWTTRTVNREGKLTERTGKHPKGEGHKFYENVAGYLTGKEELVITPEWARRPIHILDLARQSAEKGKALKAKHG